ncbi:hypothetical protein L6164_027806 [Bauhinia variegata]|uniref:Uncharacterized protein n=1 Tax=Bauhinia variegata TaxID=167791 RepID=A0ACB9LU36_BAUVA|nr:hypothetical protein L6164_027806 [Bauhinia variegata]
MQRSLSFSLPYALLHMKEMISACSQRSMKELYARNTRDLPLEVIRIRISGRECGLDGFMFHSCRGFALKPGESAKLQISYQTDFSSAMVLQDLELVLATGIFLMPLKANFPHDMLSIFGDDRASTMHTSCGRYSEQEISRHLMPTPENHKQTNHLSDTPNEKDLQSSAVQSSDTLEASQVDHLMIKTGKERGRRRRKRKGLAAKLTASSEQTLETRTSVTTVALKHFEKNQASVSAAETNKLEPEIRLKCCTNHLSFYPQGLHSAPKAVEIPSTCLPGGSSSDGSRHVSLLRQHRHLVLPLMLELLDPNLVNQKTIEVHEERPEDEYAYDIWGNHFSGIHLAGGSKNVTRMMSTPAENNIDSFFVGGPQTLVTNSEANNNKNKL